MLCCAVCCIFVIGVIISWRLFDRWYRRDFISDFIGKHVFITGTDSGFGHRLAMDLDKMGVNVYAGCFTKGGIEELKKKTSQRLKTVELDVTDQKSVEKAKNFVENDLPEGKQLWGLVNNAGILGNLSFQLSTLEDYRHTLEVNFFGAIRVTEAFAPLIKKSRGRIVQVLSVMGRGTTNAPAYACSKAAGEPFADELRRFMRSFGVKVAIVEPGYHGATGLAEETTWINVLKRKWASMPDYEKVQLGHDYLDNEIDLIRQVLLNYPLGSWNEPGMVTEAMTHALGAKHPKARYVIGYDARPYLFITRYTTDWVLDGLLRFMLWASRNKPKRSS